jgi:adenylate cyclase
MFTDIAGFTALAQADEAGALRLLQEQDRLVRPILEAHRGRKVKSIGDGELIEFANVLDAVECAVDLQRHLHEHNAREEARPIRMRVGIHLGDVQRRGTDILGDAVNIASRIEPLAEPGGVCFSEPVYVQVRNKVPYRLEKLGSKNLKGVREPMDLYRVVLPWITEEVAREGPPRPRLAVLPLANISPDANDEYFADGLTEELISVLSQVRGFRVISHTSVNQYKGTTKPIAQIASELGADSVLEGSVRKSGDQLRIAVQLIDTRTDEHRWAETYDRKLENVFAIQAEVAERTAGALRVELLRSEREALEEKPTSNLVAYQLYLRGIQASQRFMDNMTEENDRKAAKYFEAALKEDPHFSAAYATLATHLIIASGMVSPVGQSFSRAGELVAKALELNPNSSDAHTARGNLAMQADLDWARAEAEFQQAISLNPSSSTAHAYYGYLLTTVQRFAEATKHDLAAMELDPLWALPRVQLALNLVYSGNLDSAITVVEKAAVDLGESPTTRAGLAWGYALAGRVDDALKQVELLAGTTDLGYRLARCNALALLGRPSELSSLFAEWEKGRITEYFPPDARALNYCLLGEDEKALALLEQEFREGRRSLWNTYMNPEFDSVRNDPRFLLLLKTMNVPTSISRPLFRVPPSSGPRRPSS